MASGNRVTDAGHADAGPARHPETHYPLTELLCEFPDEDACLDWLWRTRFAVDGETAYCAVCGRDRRFRRYRTAQRRRSWTCTGCGRHRSVTAGTIFAGSATPLDLWFYAFYLMAATRCGISARQLERELGVTYKTAWRMFNSIREELLGYDVERARVSAALDGGAAREPPGAPPAPDSGDGRARDLRAARSSAPSTSSLPGTGIRTGS